MPGWYIHLEAAREAIGKLDPSVYAALASNGPTAAELQTIATAPENQAYFALGAIGPDLFFLLPDFKPGMGQMVYGLANTIRDLYTSWDTNFIGPWTDAMDPVTANASAQLNGLTGGLLNQLGAIASEASSFLRDFALILLSRQVDLFSVLGSGVIAAYDEKTYFWSDMLHYRKTYQFAVNLWNAALAIERNGLAATATDPKIDKSFGPRLKAYALGWMTHLGTDVAGHCFVNEKCGGPYRTHWQRHHVVENHMDAAVYNHKYGAQTRWQMLGAAGMHLWIAFNSDGSGRHGMDHYGETVPVLFDDSQRPNYPTGDEVADELGRHRIFDVDSEMPPELGRFIKDALHATYDGTPQEAADPDGPVAPHPTILASTVHDGMHADGFPTIDDITGTYWWLYHYVKYTTTDFWKLRRPEAPNVEIPDPPSPPYAGASDPPPTQNDDPLALKVEELLLLIVAAMLYVGEWITYIITFLPQLAAQAATLPLRWVLYELIELPLYNAWMGLHFYLTLTGYALPMTTEIFDGLNTLGIGIDAGWSSVWAALQTEEGGMATAGGMSEPSGHDRNTQYPRDTVEDKPQLLQALLSSIPKPFPSYPHCSSDPRGAPSEFLRPWTFPLTDNDGSTVPVELPLSVASPFVAGDAATMLIGGAPGNDGARTAFEGATDEAQTIRIATDQIAQGNHLGDPVDYSAYVIAKLTRTNIDVVHGFNLDSDRGYGYLCWDWRRSKGDMARPSSFTTSSNDYPAPLAPGSGWCQDELLGASAPAPANHTASTPVEIRYIGHEAKVG